MHENILADFDKILKGIFSSTDFSQQPKFLIEIDCQDGEILSGAFDLVKLETIRGKKINEFPFEVIALIHDASKFENVRKRLEQTPHRIAFISEISAPKIFEALDTLGVKDVESSIYMRTNAIQTDSVGFQEYAKLKSRFGIIQIHHNSKKTSPEQYILNLALLGWFPAAGSCYSYPELEITLIHFVQRSYIIRKASIDDLKILSNLENLCWPKLLGMPVEVLQKRIEIYPEGQLVLCDSEGVEGAVYSQRIDSIEMVYLCQADNVSKLHNASGPFVQLLALNISPEKQKGEYGSELLEFALQRAALTKGVTHAIGVTRCVNYPGSEKISMEDYLKQDPLDPVPRMHYKHGAEIRGVVPNYRALDKDNEGYGVLVVYALSDRVLRFELTPKEELVKGENEITSESIGISVDRAIFDLLAKDEKDKYSRKAPLMDLGIDSLQLMQLRTVLGNQYGIDLDPTFFFEYGTAESTIEYLIEIKLEPYKDWFYETKWRPISKPVPIPFVPDRLWIIFDEGGELSGNLHKRLEKNYQYCVFVKPGKEYQRIKEDAFEVNPSSPQDFSRLLLEIPHLTQLTGVIYLWGYNGLGSEITFASIETYHKLACSGIVNLANALALLNPEVLLQMER
jgi:acyl carrier protein